MPWRRDDDNAFHRFFAILDESQAVLVWQQILARCLNKHLHHPGRRRFRFISPKIVLETANVVRAFGTWVVSVKRILADIARPPKKLRMIEFGGTAVFVQN